MARNLAYFIDPEEEERGRLLEEAFGPPPPPPNLGVAPVPRLPIDMTTPRATDGNYADFHDAYEDQDPSADELADEDNAREDPPTLAEHDLDILLDPANNPNPYAPANLGDYARQLHLDRLAGAPEAVDRTAASVSAEQKGVPAQRLAAPERTDEELAQPGARTGAVAEAIASQPPASERTYGGEAGRFIAPAEQQRGERSDMFGLDDEEGFSRQRQIAKVGDLYGEEEAPSHHWEEEFLRGRERLTDAQIRRRSAVMGVFGDPGQGERWAESQRRTNNDYDSGLSNARAQDQSSRRISRAMAEAIAATGQVSPEAAVQLRMNDKLVKDFGQYASQGGRAEGQGVGLSKEKLKIIERMVNSEDKGERDKGLALLRAATQLDVAETYAHKGQPNTPDALAASANAASSLMAQALGPNVALAQGEAALKGDYRGLTAEQARKAAIVGPQILAKAGRPEGLGRVLDDSIRTHATQPVKDELAIQKSVELIRRNPEKAREWQEKWTTAQIPLKNALSGWRAMSPSAKQAFASWAQTNQDGSVIDLAHLGDQWNKYKELTPEDQIHVSRVLGAINEYVKANAGSAVTGSEWDRIAHRVGMATGTWAPFNNPEVIGQFLIDAANAMNQNRADYERIMKGWK